MVFVPGGHIGRAHGASRMLGFPALSCTDAPLGMSHKPFVAPVENGLKLWVFCIFIVSKISVVSRTPRDISDNLVYKRFVKITPA